MLKFFLDYLTPPKIFHKYVEPDLMMLKSIPNHFQTQKMRKKKTNSKYASLMILVTNWKNIIF